MASQMRMAKAQAAGLGMTASIRSSQRSMRAGAAGLGTEFGTGSAAASLIGRSRGPRGEGGAGARPGRGGDARLPQAKERRQAELDAQRRQHGQGGQAR